ncbi:MAG: hypothetical protein JOZ32_04145 [Bryobacterales bacterium]|nr:hypothetical protein [Bryobacterales bacterium]
MIRIAGLLLCVLCLASCDRLPDTYPPPEQRHPVEGYNPGPDALMVNMDDSDADSRIVKDIYGATSASWRWTSQNPTVKLLLFSTENLKFIADYAIWDDGFKFTGPLEISFLVNGNLLDKIRYTTPGVKHFDKPVPADWLSVDFPTTVSMFIDKLYVAPRDGAKFGVILVRLGFKQ